MAKKILQDQAARNVIHQVLDQNVMVLAGAGAGKTHELIGRMVDCVRTGQAEVEHMAAITFTRKAAGEMRGRFFLSLREEATTGAGGEDEYIQRALEKIDQCFIGTIHSFCGRLLRERPVEVGLAPDFTEIEEREETVLRREVWDRFIQQCFVEEDPRLNELEELGLRTEDLYTFFRQRCLFNDLPLKETQTEMPDLQPVVEQAIAFVEEVQSCIPDDLPKGPDPFMEVLTRIEHFLRYRTMESVSERVAFLKMLDGKQDVKVTYWGENRDFAKELRDEQLPGFQENILAPTLVQWRQYVYRHVAAFVDDAMHFYDTERHRTGKLTFQDLLQKATALLRNHPAVRRYFQKRYQCLFIDEFQDTDPVQAEMLFYLTGTDLDEKDWRPLVPRPGSLFLVGDDKQSIYRFRRADVETFRLVCERIRETGGQVVQLNTSFRSLGHMCDWVNDSFPLLFADHQKEYQADFSPLLKNRPEGMDARCVRKLAHEYMKGHPRGAIAERDAECIADFIAAAVAGNTEFNGNGEEAILGKFASPGDFMILTRTTGYLATYARALEERGLPFDIVGGARLGEADELKALMDMLEAVYMPDNPIPLLGYLRGAFMGLGDDELYTFHKAGGQFNYKMPLPEDLDEELRLRIEMAFGRLEQIARWMQTSAPATAFERLLEDLGLVAFSVAKDMGSSRAGNLLRLQALVREWEDQGMHWGQILSEMRALVGDLDYKVEEMTLEAGQEDVVRLMNLHQAKGLQSKVVFLADPYDTSMDRHGVGFHVSRTEGKPFLSLPVLRPRGLYQSEIIAEPKGWAEDVAVEERFLEAEKLRLLYVAATRGCNLLVVSCYEGNRAKGPWSLLYDYLDDVPELPVYIAPEPSAPEVLPMDWDRQRGERAERWQKIQQPTYALHSATGKIGRGDEPLSSGGDRGKDYGSVMHALFKAAIDGSLPDDEVAFIRQLMEGTQLEAAMVRNVKGALDTFRASEIWEEIQQTEDVFTEAPFAVSIKKDEMSEINRGIVDLVYRISGGWKIVDYKTDRATSEEEVQALVDRYGSQLNDYARQWAEVTGERVIEKGLWLTAARRWQRV